MLEVWKKIEGFDGYAISNFGKILSLERTIIKSNGRKQRNKELIKKTHVAHNKYYSTTIKNKPLSIHRLLAEHFIPNPLNLPCVDHIDQDKSNNQLNNFRWVTYSMNSQNIRMCHPMNKLGIKNISFNEKRNYYDYRKIINGKIHRKRFKTLEEAIDFKKSNDK